MLLGCKVGGSGRADMFLGLARGGSFREGASPKHQIKKDTLFYLTDGFNEHISELALNTLRYVCCALISVPCSATPIS